MSNATWKIASNEDRFTLEVTTESEHRPGTIYHWQGEIQAEQTGVQCLRTMSLKEIYHEEISCEEISGGKVEIQPKEIYLHYQIYEVRNSRATFTKAASACDKETQRMEQAHMKREEEERRNKKQFHIAVQRLNKMEAEGVHQVVIPPQAAPEQNAPINGETWNS